MANLGSDNTPIEGESFGLPSGYAVDEENGDLVIRDTDGTVAMRRADGTWELESDLALNENDISGVGAFDSESVNTESLANGVAGVDNTIEDLAGTTGEVQTIAMLPWRQGDVPSISSTDYTQLGSDDFRYDLRQFDLKLTNASQGKFRLLAFADGATTDVEHTIRLKNKDESGEATATRVGPGLMGTGWADVDINNLVVSVQARLEEQSGSDEAAYRNMAIAFGLEIGT